MRARDLTTGAFGLAALLLSTLAIGGAPRYAVVLIGLCAACAAASQVRSRRQLERTSPLLAVLGVAIVFTAIQLIPLPPGLRELLNSEGHGLIDDGHRLLGNDPDAWRPLSVDPPATLVELAKFMAYALLAWMALRAATSERGRARLLMAVAGTAGLIVVTALIHELLDADTLFGIYKPSRVSPVVMAPLLNANHLASFLALGAIVAAGLAVHEIKVPARRVIWILIAVGSLAVMLMTRSRGGVVGFGAGAIISAVLMVLQQVRSAGSGSRKDVLRIAVPAAITVLCSIVLVVYIGGDNVTKELENTRFEELSDSRSKYAAWDSSLELIREAPVLGVGRGGFETSFTRVHPQSGEVTFARVENQYLQTVIDWGIAGALAFAIAIGMAVRVVLRRWHRGALSAAAIGGITAVATQSLVDFGLELPGLAVPTIIVAATLLYVPLRESPRSMRARTWRMGAVVATALVAMLAGSDRGKLVGEDHANLKRPGDLETARASLARHPLDYLSAAHIANRANTPREQIAFINHSLRLHPTHPDLHLVVARWLASTRRYQQAGLEYRFALNRGLKVELLVDEVVARMPKLDAARALPTTNRLWLRIVKALLARQHSDIAVAYMEIALEDDENRDIGFWRQLQLLAVQNDKPDLALRAARRLALLEPSVAATIKVAEAQVKVGDLDGALATLRPIASGPAVSQSHVDAHILRCKVMVTQKSWAPAKVCLSQALTLPSIPMVNRKQLHGELAKVEEALGNHHAAALERELAGEKGIEKPTEVPYKTKAQ